MFVIVLTFFTHVSARSLARAVLKLNRHKQLPITSSSPFWYRARSLAAPPESWDPRSSTCFPCSTARDARTVQYEEGRCGCSERRGKDCKAFGLESQRWVSQVWHFIHSIWTLTDWAIRDSGKSAQVLRTLLMSPCVGKGSGSRGPVDTRASQDTNIPSRKWHGLENSQLPYFSCTCGSVESEGITLTVHCTSCRQRKPMHGQDKAFFFPSVALIWDSLEPWMWLNPEDEGLIVFFLSAPANSFGV